MSTKPLNKFSYLRDENNFDRVLTICRQFDRTKKKVVFGWSLNSPTHWVRTEGKDRVEFVRVKGDQFSRKEGKRIAMERMLSDSLTATVSGKDVPLKAVLRHLLSDNDLKLPHYVFEIASQYVDQIPDYEPRVTENPKPKPSALDRVMSFFRGA